MNTHVFVIKNQHVPGFMGEVMDWGIRTYTLSAWNALTRTYSVELSDDLAIILRLKYS